MSADARMVRLPPFSMLRAAPRKRLGGYSAVESTPPDRMRPEAGCARLYARARQDDDVLAAFHQALRALDDQLGHGDVVLGGHVERGGDDLALDRALHVGHLFGALVH